MENRITNHDVDKSIYSIDNPPTRPNLLHNWYFPNPVNRQGKTEYDTSGASAYIIDRWWSIFTKTTITEDGLHLQGMNNNYGAIIRQAIANPKNLAGKTVTFSVWTKNRVNPLHFALTKGTGINNNLVSIKSVVVNEDLASYTVTLPDDVGSESYPVLMLALNAVGTGSFDIIAVKVEFGDTQTLAHQENGVWVLNEVPDYAEQMAICMQYNKTTGEYTGITASDVGAFHKIANITSGSMNDYWEEGIYHIKSGSFIANITELPPNYPKSASEVLCIRDTQIIMSYNGAGGYYSNIYARARYIDSGEIKYREWVRLATDKDLEKYLLTDGSVSMSGDLKIRSDYARLSYDIGGTVFLPIMEVAGDFNNRRQISLHGGASGKDIKESLKLYEIKNGSVSNGGDYNIFGEHNKPSGSYTGNGSATERKIEIGGIGKALCITAENASWFMAFVHNSGAVIFDTKIGSTFYLKGAEAKYVNGVLTLATTNNYLNGSTTAFRYFDF